MMKYLAFLFSIYLYCLMPSLLWADSVNRLAANAPEKVAAVEKVIRQNLGLLKSSNVGEHPVIAQKYGVPIRNPFTQLPKKVYQTFSQQGIDLKAMSQYKAVYITGTLTGASSLKIVNTDPKTVLVLGWGAVFHEGIYSRGPVVVVGNAHIMSEIYSESLVWYGELISAGSGGFYANIGLPLVTSSKGGNDSLGVSPYTIKEEILAMQQLGSKTHFSKAVQYGKAISNPLNNLTPTQTQTLKKRGVAIESLRKKKALLIEEGSDYFGSILNTDPNTLLMVTARSNIYSLGPVIVKAQYSIPTSLLIDDLLWINTTNSHINNSWRGRPLVVGGAK